jgi:hypothetical protein
MRELSPDGRCRYLDTETKKPVTEWSPRDEGASARIAVRSMLNLKATKVCRMVSPAALKEPVKSFLWPQQA